MYNRIQSGAVYFNLGQFISMGGSFNTVCRQGAVFPGGSCRLGAVVARGQLSPGAVFPGAVVARGQLLPGGSCRRGQLSAGAAVGGGVVGGAVVGGGSCQRTLLHCIIEYNQNISSKIV